jgi:hypothetical protein
MELLVAIALVMWLGVAGYGLMALMPWSLVALVGGGLAANCARLATDEEYEEPWLAYHRDGGRIAVDNRATPPESKGESE